MREILFRGAQKVDCAKSLIWYEGLLIIETDGYTGEKKYYIQNENGSYLVISETVGQYTGLTDKNGKKIFEGDIVHLYAGEHSISRYKGIDYNALVIFKDGGFCAIDGTEDDYALRRYNFVSRNLYCEVIGNIHDNPELLKETEQK